MKKIGLTGGIASGKSTCVDILIERNFKVIDSDKIVKDILSKDVEVLEYIREEFGEKFVRDGRLINEEFGRYIFSNAVPRKKYEGFIIPKILQRIDESFLTHEMRGEKLCILDAPILIEKGLHKHMDYVVVVWISREEQLRRLISRDNMDKKSAIDRINSQIDINLKKGFADFIIDNSGGREYLIKQIEHLCLFLKTL